MKRSALCAERFMVAMSGQGCGNGEGEFVFGCNKPIPLPLPVGRGEEKRFVEIFGIMMPKISTVSSCSPPRFGLMGGQASNLPTPNPSQREGNHIFVPFFGGMPPKKGLIFLPFLPILGGRGQGDGGCPPISRCGEGTGVGFS